MCLLVERKVEEPALGAYLEAYKVVVKSGWGYYVYRSPMQMLTRWELGVELQAGAPEDDMEGDPLPGFEYGAGFLHMFVRAADALRVRDRLIAANPSSRAAVLAVRVPSPAWYGQVVGWSAAHRMLGVIARAATPLREL